MEDPGRSAAAGAALSRSRLYALLSRALAFPQPELHHEAASGSLRQQITGAVQALPYRLAVGASRDWRAIGQYDAFQSEYIRLFEVGPRGHAACPLHGGHYSRDRLRTMEELVRFYNYFGLRITQGLMPDHVTVELEFMHFLAHREAEASEAGADAASYVRAERDFLERHLNAWWPAVPAAAQRHRPPRFYRSLMSLIERFLAAELRHLASAQRDS